MNYFMKKLYLILFWKYNTLPPWGKYAPYNKLQSKLEYLHTKNILFYPNKTLPDSYSPKKTATAKVFSNENKAFLVDEIRNLASSDRILDSLVVHNIQVDDYYIELLIEEDPKKKKKKIGRLKSRLATLLSFKFPNQYKGKNTWAKGILKVEFKSSHFDVITHIKNFK